MNIKILNNRLTLEQLSELVTALKVHETSDRVLPKDEWEIKQHTILQEYYGEYGIYQLTLHFNKDNDSLLRVEILVY